MSIEAKSATVISVAFESRTRTRLELTQRVRDILLERQARCLLDRITYKLELAEKYGDVDQDHVSSLRDSEAAIKKLLKSSDGGV
jgi:hypothetical protein